MPGLLHDHCSAFHPMGVGSPYLRTLDLERYGLRWRWPEIDCAHPLDSGDAGLLWRSLELDLSKRKAAGAGTPLGCGATGRGDGQPGLRSNPA